MTNIFFTQAGVAWLTGVMTNLGSQTLTYYGNWATVATSARTDTTMTEGTEARVSITGGNCTTQTTSFANDTVKWVFTQTCNATGKTILSAGFFTASSSGTLIMEGDLSSGIAVVQNDQIQFTFTLQFT